MRLVLWVKISLQAGRGICTEKMGVARRQVRTGDTSFYVSGWQAFQSIWRSVPPVGFPSPQRLPRSQNRSENSQNSGTPSAYKTALFCDIYGYLAAHG
jgi:hypothetical protein